MKMIRRQYTLAVEIKLNTQMKEYGVCNSVLFETNIF